MHSASDILTFGREALQRAADSFPPPRAMIVAASSLTSRRLASTSGEKSVGSLPLHQSETSFKFACGKRFKLLSL
jgi:hypothetical protein